MSVISKIATITNDDNLLSLAITLVLSTTLIGYAPSNIAMGIFVFIALIKYLKNRTKLRVDLKLLLPLLLYLFFAVSYFWSVDKDLTLKGLGRLLPFLIIPTTFSIIPRFTAKNINLILKYFTFSNIVLGILFLIVAIFNYLKTKSIGSFTYHQLVDVLELNAIYVSVFYSISYFFLLTKTNKKYTDFIGIIFLSFMIVLLSSKTIITAFVLGNLIYLVFVLGFKSLKSFKTIIVIVLVAVTIFISSSEITDRILVETTTKIEDVFKKERFNEVYPWTGTSIRLLQLRNLKDQIAEDDIFWSGFGVFASRKNLKERHSALNTYKEYHNYNYHNMYAQMLSELGIFGLSLLLLIIISGFIKALRSKYYVFFFFYFLMAMTFLTESFLWVQRGLFLFVILHCLIIRTDFNNMKTKAI